jgi:50S ribosomal protein L16 3-hydroxylase
MPRTMGKICRLCVLSIAIFDSISTKAFTTRHQFHLLHERTDVYSTKVDVVDGPFEIDYLKKYWCRAPLLIRNAFNPSDDALPAWEDILELARDADAGESARLITHVPSQLDSFQLRFGPFDNDDFEELKSDKTNEKWTLLVNDVDRYLPDLCDWVDAKFAAIPRWRRDDAMVSLAPAGGGIGPHVDSYDVFLIQLKGKRTWRAGPTLSHWQERNALVPDLPVRILQTPYEYQEFVVQAGDCLYLPPRVSHWGTSITDDCITLSVGCRTPSAAELVARVAEVLATSVTDIANRRYSDPDLFIQSPNNSSLSISVKESMKQLVLDGVNEAMDDGSVWDELVGRLVTEPLRYSETAVQPLNELIACYPEFADEWGSTPSDIIHRVKAGHGVLYRTQGISFATSTIHGNDHSSIHRIYWHGIMKELRDDHPDSALLSCIEKSEPVDGEMLLGMSGAQINLVEEMIFEGLLYASQDSRDEDIAVNAKA